MTKKLAKVFHAELFGKRNDKFKHLEKDFTEIEWKELDVQDPYYFFVPKDFASMEEYEKGFSIIDLMSVNNSGIKTDRDSLFIDKDKKYLAERFQILLSGDFDDDFKIQYRIKDSGSYKITQKIIDKSFDEKYLQKIQYRAFDYQWIYYDPSLVSRSAQKAMRHIVSGENIGLLTARSIPQNQNWDRVLCTNQLVDIHAASDQTYLFPLYLYHSDGTRTANLDVKMVKRFADELGMEFVDAEEKQDSRLRGNDACFTPENVLDYIYAVLHSPAYREKYKEFLKINFPRIPYPKDMAGENGNVNEVFAKLVSLGKQIREIHLLESSETENYVTTFPVAGDNVLEKKFPKWDEILDQVQNDEVLGNVYINETQYFGNVPKSAWEFYIGGYQPAQKWLKDRKENMLSFDDILHWQKIIVALKRTGELMKEVDTVITL